MNQARKITGLNQTMRRQKMPASKKSPLKQIAQNSKTSGNALGTDSKAFSFSEGLSGRQAAESLASHKVLRKADIESFARGRFFQMVSVIKSGDFDQFTRFNYDSLKKLDEKTVLHKGKEALIEKVDPEIRKAIYKVYYRELAGQIATLPFEEQQLPLVKGLLSNSMNYNGSGIKDEKLKDQLKALGLSASELIKDNFIDKEKVLGSAVLNFKEIVNDRKEVNRLVTSNLDRASDISLNIYLKFKDLIADKNLDDEQEYNAYAYCTIVSLKSMIKGMLSALGKNAKGDVRKFLSLMMNSVESSAKAA